MPAITSAEDRDRLQRIWKSAAYGATPKDLLWLTQQTVRLVAERDALISKTKPLQGLAPAQRGNAPAAPLRANSGAPLPPPPAAPAPPRSYEKRLHDAWPKGGRERKKTARSASVPTARKARH